AHSLTNKLSATTDRREAFKGADFIISSIEVGNRFKLWDEDWKVPLQYGSPQVYGENGGPGGVFHALRIVPPILEIVRDAMEVCPKAYIFNFSNPMTAICTTVARAFPEARFIGLCHEIGWLSRWLPRILGMDQADIGFRAAGLNHFSCALEIKDRRTGRDLYPETRAKAAAFFARDPGYSDLLDEYRATGKMDSVEAFHKGESVGPSRFEWADRKLVKFMLENYGLLPITTDSHFGEYLGWASDVVDHRGILDFYDLYKVMLGQEARREIVLKVSERVVPIIEGIVGDLGYEEEAVNLPNGALIPDLPSWIAVEVPAMVGKAGIQGIGMGDLPKGYLGLLREYCGVYDLVAEAVIHKKKDLVIQALLANPVVHKAAGLREMLDRMIDLQSPWLDYLR
ncbi:MAG: alpha-glucosidase, partial [Spirochaetaceae bacterium]|nr:alpha-glucosidase [Spirochaetaceae bacterium]